MEESHQRPDFGSSSFAFLPSESFRQVMAAAERVAGFETSVLISGETGVGKEIVGRYIHFRSQRSKYRFLAVNCSALPETLLESELFGHKAGSFTGAVRDRVGHFEQAARGTIFLDEIGDISPAIQLRLLRVLQEREIFRVGESIPRKVDARVIAATNRNLRQAKRDGQFREDLYYRLRVIEIHVPPLRDRIEDIAPLIEFFSTGLARKLHMARIAVRSSALRRLREYCWPGNIRELQNVIESAAVLSGQGEIGVQDLPPEILYPQPEIPTRAEAVYRSLREVEYQHIMAVLQATGGNRKRAAQTLGISKSTLWRKLRAFERGQ